MATSLPRATVLLLALGAGAPAAVAQGPSAGDQVFRAVARSVYSVHVFDPAQPAARKLVALGSAVVYAPGRLVTNCHVLAPGIGGDASLQPLLAEIKAAGQRGGRRVRLASADPARDLCILDAPGLDAPAVALGSTRGLAVGQPVYAVGSPRGLELTLSGGLVSALRKSGAEPVIQTDASVSPGSSGGGLFDAQGRLIGITSFNVQGGQNLNFALPVEWIKDAAARGTTAADFGAIVAYWRRLAQGGAGARGVTSGGGRWALAASSGQGYDVYVDLGRLSRSGGQAQAWILHNFHAPVTSAGAGAYKSRVLLADIDCAAGRWSLRHAATYTEAFATGRRLSADDFTPTEADYRNAAPGTPMDTVRAAACR
jgi:S1-C subfamily serine protease